MNYPWFQPVPHHLIGQVVSVSNDGYKHKGLISDRMIDGELAIISLSKAANGVLEESLSSFACGRDVTIDGYFGTLSPYDVVRNARALIGTTYDLFSNNCEHFVRKAHGVYIESPQVKGWLLITGFLGLIALVS